MLHRATTAVLLLAVSSRAASAGAEVTFTKDIAPIMFAQCASCHRPGGSGPFSVLDFSDVRPRARIIAAAVQRRTMPPWMPEPGHGDFIGARRLTEDQITAIVRWADAGAPLGDPAAMPSPPQLRDGWPLGRPDLIVDMPNPYRLPPGGPDRRASSGSGAGSAPKCIGGHDPKNGPSRLFRSGQRSSKHQRIAEVCAASAKCAGFRRDERTDQRDRRRG